MILRAKDKLQICAIAARIFQEPVEIWAYGSRVDGTAHDTSDLDLVVRNKALTRLDIDEFIDFKEALTNSNIPILVQVMDWGRIPQSFHKNILLAYEVLKPFDEKK